MSNGTQEQKKPQPAAGQLWRFAQEKPDVLLHVETNPYTGDVAHFAHFAPLVHFLKHDPRWQCVGIETANGRVIVGERRESDCPSSRGAHTVNRAIDGIMVSMMPDGETQGLAFSARRVASWPIVASPIVATTAKDDVRKEIARLRNVCARALSYGDPSNIRVEVDERKARVSFFVRRGDVAPHVLRAAETILREEAPSCITVGLFVDTKCKCGAPLTASMAMCPGCAVDACLQNKVRTPLGDFRIPDHELETVQRTVAEYAAKYMGARIMPIMPDYGLDISAYTESLKDAACNRIDTREQGAGIANLSVARPEVRPDLVACSDWERWSLP